jgi:hypothetical protein
MAKDKKKFMELQNVFILCKSDDIGQALDALNDLGFCIERHKKNKYDDIEYMKYFIDKSYFNLRLSDEDIDLCIYYLFYLLMNYFDRASRVAWCLDKCYDESIIYGLVHAIELYSNYNDDDTVFGLLMAITSVHELKTVDPKIIEILKWVQTKGMKDTNEFLITAFEVHGIN